MGASRRGVLHPHVSPLLIQETFTRARAVRQSRVHHEHDHELADLALRASSRGNKTTLEISGSIVTCFESISERATATASAVAEARSTDG